MALQIVDIFGNLQPGSGRTLPSGNFLFIPSYKKYKYNYDFYVDSINYNDAILNPKQILTWDEFYKNYTDLTSLEQNGYVKLSSGTYKKDLTKKLARIISINNLYITDVYQIKTPIAGITTMKGNIIINLEETDIFKKTVRDKLDCIAQVSSLGGDPTLLTKSLAALFFTSYFEFQTNYNRLPESSYDSNLQGAETKINDFLKSIKFDLDKNISSGTWKKENVPACFLPDPDPALPGPPTQAINCVANKAPVVDNPNLKLPSQEVKGLDANAAQQAASQAQGAASNTASQVQSAAGGLTSQVQGAAGQAQGALEGAAGQAQSAIGGAQESAGGVLSNLSSGVKGAIGGGTLGAGIGVLAGGGKGALIGAGAGLVAGGVAGKVFDKLNPKGIKPDGLGKDWSPDKFSPESIAGNDKFVNAKTGMVESTSELAKGLKGGLLGGALGAGIGALAGGGKGALIGGLSGTALGAGLSVGGVTGGALAGGGLGVGIGGIVGGGKGAVIGAVSGGAVGAAAAKLASVQKGMPKPNIPKPPSTPRIKTVKIPRPSNPKGATDLLNLPKSPLG
jgi:hypothetical protein